MNTLLNNTEQNIEGVKQDPSKKIILALRWIGGGAILLSSVQFMLAGKLDLNSIQTHYLFLALTCGLTLLGILTAKKIQDLATARIFLGLSLALIPPQIAQIGGFIIAKIGKSLKKSSEKSQQKMADILSVIDENIGGLRVVKLFNAERKVHSKFENESGKYRSLMTSLLRKKDLS